MKRLILMRHAKTEPWFQGSDDISRALLPRGKTDTRRIADELIDRDWLPDTALLSSARRTRETWLEMADHFPSTDRHILDELYLTGTRGLRDLVKAYEACGTLIVIGHNPGIHDFACQIAAEAGTQSQPAALVMSLKMPTGAVALFEAANDQSFRPEAFRLIDFVKPKSLREEI